MKNLGHINKGGIILMAFFALSGCVGPIAQQLASSIILRGADKITANAYEAQQRQEQEKGIVLKDTVPDEYYAAFISSGFETVTPTTQPLPESSLPAPGQETPTRIESARLVRVELWNFLLGDEKRTVLEKAYILGSESVPPVSEWDRWQVATGASEATANQPITFLVPPELGKVRAGGNAVVEIVPQGGVHIARYVSTSTLAQIKGQSALIASQSGQSRPSYSR